MTGVRRVDSARAASSPRGLADRLEAAGRPEAERCVEVPPRVHSSLDAWAARRGTRFEPVRSGDGVASVDPSPTAVRRWPDVR